MNWPSARSMRASPLFSTTKRAPESFAAVSKSICRALRRARNAASARTGSCASRRSDGARHCRVSSLPSGTSSSGRFGIAASTSSSSFEYFFSSASSAGIVSFSCRDLGHQRLRGRLVLVLLRRADLLRGRVAPRLRLLRPSGSRARRFSSSASSFADSAGSPRRSRPRSKASGFSRIHLMSCMAARGSQAGIGAARLYSCSAAVGGRRAAVERAPTAAPYSGRLGGAAPAALAARLARGLLLHIGAPTRSSPRRAPSAAARARAG